MPTVYVKTLGCKVNTYDSRALENQLQELGYRIVDSPEQANISILNSCSVTSNADREARSLLRRFKRKSPKGLTIAAGRRDLGVYRHRRVVPRRDHGDPVDADLRQHDDAVRVCAGARYRGR